MTKLTNKGFERTRLIDRIAELNAEARAIFGQDIDLSSSTMDGQHLGIFAESVADLDELAELVWISFDPDLASGASLSRLAKLNGIERSQGAYSVATLLMTGTANTLIPKGSIVSNQDGSVTVYTLKDVRLTSDGYGEVAASPKETGAINAPANSLTKIKSPIFGWSTVNNAEPMSAGKVKETDQQLRLRRRASVSRGNRNMTDSLWAVISDLEGVIEVAVLENPSNKEDKRGLSPHSVHAVVLGGDDIEIAQAIWSNKTGGSILDGNETVIIKDLAGGDQQVKFSRAVSVPVKIKVSVAPRVGWSYKTKSQIREVLFEYINSNQRVGEDLVSSNLYSPLNEIGGFSINKVYLAKQGFLFAEQSLRVDFNERVNVDINDIEIVQS